MEETYFKIVSRDVLQEEFNLDLAAPTKCLKKLLKLLIKMSATKFN